MQWRIFTLLGFLTIATSGGAVIPRLLESAIAKLQADENHWAYTQTTQEFDLKGEPKKGATIERFDPSQPLDRQWSLSQWKGGVPTAREERAWKRKKEKEMARREEKTLGEVMNFDRAELISEKAGKVDFEIPLQSGASRRLPADKFVVHVTVDQESETLEGFSLRTKEAFRAYGVAKIETIEIEAAFATAAEPFAPQLEKVTARGVGKILFLRVGGAAEMTWSDYQRVKPYADRFEVKFGELKAFGF